MMTMTDRPEQIKKIVPETTDEIEKHRRGALAAILDFEKAHCREQTANKRNSEFAKTLRERGLSKD